MRERPNNYHSRMHGTAKKIEDKVKNGIRDASDYNAIFQDLNNSLRSKIGLKTRKETFIDEFSNLSYTLNPPFIKYIQGNAIKSPQMPSRKMG